MSKYLATINVPGYLPMDDDPPEFDTAFEAWMYLAHERREAEDEYAEPEVEAPYSSVVDDLDAHMAADQVGVVYGDTPGYDGDHDLGLAYCVQEAE